MDALATVTDLASRWKVLDNEEQSRATTLLLDATAFIRAALSNSGVSIDDTDEVQAAVLTAVTCNIVKRAMQTPVDQPPLSGFTQSAGVYSEAQTYVNPSGDMYLTANEKKWLGIGAARIGTIAPMIGAREEVTT